MRLLSRIILVLLIALICMKWASHKPEPKSLPDNVIEECPCPEVTETWIVRAPELISGPDGTDTIRR